MKTCTLQFEKFLDLELFLDMMDAKPSFINIEQLQLTGILPEKDIELAKSAFAAVVFHPS